VSPREIRLQKVRASKKRNCSEETDSDRQITLQKVRESQKRKISVKGDSERQLRLKKTASMRNEPTGLFKYV
jgi:hypothetical protein